MREPQLRKLHRRAGIVLAPLLVLQALSGILFSTGVGGAAYHILLGIAVVSVAASGLVIFFQIHARLRR